MIFLFISRLLLRGVRVFVVFTVLFACANLEVKPQESEDTATHAVKLFNQGQDAHEKGDLSTAIDLYQMAVKLLPEFPEAELQKGNAQLVIGDTENAERSFRRAVELRPEWSLALSSLGSTLVFSEKFDEARLVLKKALGLESQNFQALSAQADLLIKTRAPAGELRALLEQLVSLTGKASPTASIWASRGAVEQALNDPIAARTSFLKARELDPNHKAAIFGLADVALSESDVEKAKALITAYSKLSPESDAAKLLQARLLIMQGQPAEALKLLTTVKRQTVAVSELRDAIAVNLSSSVPDLVKKLESDPKNIAVLERLCSLNRVNDPAAALEYCRRASEAEPHNVKHAVGYGAALVQSRRFEDAAALMGRLRPFAPDNVTLRASLATALFELKRYEEAKPEFRWLAEKQPQRPIPHYFLAITHDQLQEYVDAMANYQRFLKLADPEQQRLEIEKVNLRLPALDRLIKEKKGKR